MTSASQLLPELVHTIPKIDDTPQKLLASYDYVIAGGGTAGCLVAGRLCEDPNVSVLLIEAGPDDRTVPAVKVPWYGLHLLGTDVDWMRKTTSQEHACKALVNEQSDWGSAKILGGNFSHNAMHYVRGNPSDYEYWMNELGCDGWGWEDVFRYFKKSEGNNIPGLDEGFHNSDGPLPINKSSEKETTEVARAFVDGLDSIGVPKGDFNGTSQLRCSKIPFLKTEKERWSTVDAFVRPAVKQGNLIVQTNAQVTRILLNETSTAAVGVEFQDSISGERRTVCASREVIVSGGAIHSPQILMLSGIGPKAHLESVGIKCRVDLPAVGQNLQDHCFAPMEFQSKVPIKNPLSVETPENLKRWVEHGDGPLAANTQSLEATAFIQTGERPDLDAHGQPDIQLYLWSLGPGEQQQASEELALMSNIKPEFHGKDFHENQFTVFALLLHPKSIGFVELASNDPFESPVIDPKYLENEVDVKCLVGGLKKLLQLTKTPAMEKVVGPPVPQRECPYEFGTDEYLEWVIRHFTNTGFHWVGSCSMGDTLKTSVVDPTLSVHGVKNLSVIDGSVLPTLPSGNTCAPIIMVAEKGADFIKQRHLRRSKL